MAKLIAGTYKKLSKSLSICECTKDSEGPQGFWIHDKELGFNVAMRIPDRDLAFVTVIHYYQKRLKGTEEAYSDLQSKVDFFVDQFVEIEKEEA